MLYINLKIGNLNQVIEHHIIENNGFNLIEGNILIYKVNLDHTIQAGGSSRFENDEPISERLIFRQPKDKLNVDISFKYNKFSPGDK